MKNWTGPISLKERSYWGRIYTRLLLSLAPSKSIGKEVIAIHVYAEWLLNLEYTDPDKTFRKSETGVRSVTT
jgi:hypothetical protein